MIFETTMFGAVIYKTTDGLRRYVKRSNRSMPALIGSRTLIYSACVNGFIDVDGVGNIFSESVSSDLVWALRNMFAPMSIISMLYVTRRYYKLSSDVLSAFVQLTTPHPFSKTLLQDLLSRVHRQQLKMPVFIQIDRYDHQSHDSRLTGILAHGWLGFGT